MTSLFVQDLAGGQRTVATLEFHLSDSPSSSHGFWYQLSSVTRELYILRRDGETTFVVDVDQLLLVVAMRRNIYQIELV